MMPRHGWKFATPRAPFNTTKNSGIRLAMACSTTNARQAEMLAGSNGKGIIIDSDCAPSAPLSGGPSQVFGLVEGKMIPFGKPLYVQGDMEGFVPGEVTKLGQATMISADMLK